MKRRIIWAAAGCLCLTALFCFSFVLFYTRAQQEKQAAALADSLRPVSKPLPAADLVNVSGQKLEDGKLRTGKVILVFLSPGCRACHKEVEFLKTVVGKRSDVTFYGVISFGGAVDGARPGGESFPFEVFYDDKRVLSDQLGINRVPIKVFVEDGVIKKAWGGATNDEQSQKSFGEWLEKI